MLNLMLDKMKIFGFEFDWPLESALFWLLIVQVALIMFMVLVFAILIKRVGTNKIVVDTKPSERTLTGLTLDLSMVKRKFDVGEQFNADGLIVTANYNLEPMSEPLPKFAVFTPDTLETLKQQGPIDVCYVLAGDTSAEGKVSVTVCYQGQQAAYTISVGEKDETVAAQPQAQPQPVVQQPIYIAAPFVQPQPEPQPEPQEEPRVLLGLDLDLSAVRREFTVGEDFTCDGIVVTANYDKEPLSEQLDNLIVVTDEAYNNIVASSDGDVVGCYVIQPEFAEEGVCPVTVRFGDAQASYNVNVTMPQPEEEPEPERALVGITLDLAVVQREFTVGDEFNCDGLLVTANYTAEPVAENIADYTLVNEEEFGRLAEADELDGCYVVEPDMSKEGKYTVSVRYGEQTAPYTIAVNEPAVEEEDEPEEEVVDIKSIFDEEDDREPVGITIDVEVVQREFNVGDEFNCDGLLITANFDKDPLTESIVDYSIVDEELFHRIASASEIAGCYVVKPDMKQPGKKAVSVRYEKFTAYYTIAVGEPEPEVEPERVLQYISLNTDNVQKEFVEGDALNYDNLEVTAHFNVEPLEENITDYSVVAPDMNQPGTPTVSVVFQDRTVGYRITIAPLPEEERRKREAVIIEEESAEAGRLRYDKSFTARIIQSDDEIKNWYTEIKNELLSYKKAKCRMSWKRETFKVGKEVVAKLSFRGKTMCLFLALDVNDYADSKYQLEDVSNIPSNADTPAMYRLKSAKRIKYAGDLIAAVMEKHDAPRIERESEDYYMPYEGIVELIKKGLVKRDIKSAEDEAIFNQGKSVEEQPQTESAEPVEIAPGLYVTSRAADEKADEAAATEAQPSEDDPKE